MNPTELIQYKYKQRERGTVLSKIIKEMRQWSITFDELKQYDDTHEVNLQQQVLAIRKRQNVKAQKVAEHGRRKVKAE